ncbi:alpha-L-rhamnosidase-like protein [Paenibacillus cellulosilyticus]|uniref:Alpha-L-rhamnosidase-like protein n=2 Tax=Paenibacillus cellulosilyticus TaxID=375489 RepID=A0A2V2YSG0_9BACL|nr:glycosylhydrolase-like jelly roll fold domain-containing protein [Paenibacillus cellulosilyticus]PWW00990.1 alpha-L-rhamnosidase-like protein [Paenibacillus cellulosilyticus]QKS48823.1 hypothetical protein HUB94_25010 [Paenibacillus cellulosilyticus]
MNTFETLKQQFIAPAAEFSPIPFWFWNDELTREELIRQIHEFHSKGVDGFVIHPRMGLSRQIPYLSDTYMDLVEAAVEEAARLGMSVILYDEGMYPSGSACGLVVKHNPDYASRGLQLQEIPCEKGIVSFPIQLSSEETLVSVQAVKKRSEREVEEIRPITLVPEQNVISFTLPDEGEWSILVFVDTPSGGTIRGVHEGQDDGEPDAPLAADLLNPDAVQTFISLTHDRYYARLNRYFGTTIFAMFTDEPDLLGRSHKKDLKPWTRSFMNDLQADGMQEKDLAALWFEVGDATERTRNVYENAVRNRMSRTYYKPLSDWCEAHGIGLTGHPAASDDIGLLEHFHIPGQDVVWRYIAPEADKGITGVHSTMGKCSSDAARHRGRRRNLNESFGVCGSEGGWTLTADNMKWYLDWLFVRGVNLISPHAFYYSIRGARRDERPPDVGPNNIWWSEYNQISSYIKRMSWLMTDSKNGAEVAVLAGAAYLPWRIVRPLYERQVEFNYLEESLLNNSCRCTDGMLEIADYRYKAIVIEDGHRLEPSSWQWLERFAEQGGYIVELSGDGSARTLNIGQARIGKVEKISELLLSRLGSEVALEPAASTIRISRVTKDGIHFYVVVNEGEEPYEGAIRTRHGGQTEIWNPWTGECGQANGEQAAEGQNIVIRIERRECLILAVDPQASFNGSNTESTAREIRTITDLSEDWQVIDGPWTGERSELTSWTGWSGMEHYSGTVTYVKEVELEEDTLATEYKLDLGDAHELVRLEVNDQVIGTRMWKPYVFELEQVLKAGVNRLRISVTNSLANRYDGKSLPSGLIGPVRLLALQERET